MNSPYTQLLIALFLIAIAVHYALANKEALLLNICYSTIAGCFFYIIFNIIPSISSQHKQRLSVSKKIAKLLTNCANFDKALAISDTSEYVGFNGGYVDKFRKISDDTTYTCHLNGIAPEYFSGNIKKLIDIHSKTTHDIIFDIFKSNSVHDEIQNVLTEIMYKTQDAALKEKPQIYRTEIWKKIDLMLKIMRKINILKTTLSFCPKGFKIST